MKKKVFAILIALAVQIVCLGQTNREMLEQDPYRALGNMYPYHQLDSVYTPAHEGYELFYVSYTGRHGSRYLLDFKDRVESLKTFEKYKEKGWLTEEGLRLYDDLSDILKASEGKEGKLSSLGERELQGIGGRLRHNTGGLFRDSAVIETYSTKVDRVMKTRDNLLKGLCEGIKPDVKYFEANVKKDQKSRCSKEVRGHYMEPEYKERETNQNAHRGYYRALWKNEYDASSFRNRIFTPDARIGDPCRESSNLLSIGTSCLTSGEPMPDITKYFTADELYYIWERKNIGTFSHSCLWDGCAPYRTYNWGAGIVECIMEDADEVISGKKNVTATLRFTHDSYLIPVQSFMDIEGVNFRTMAQAEKYFRNYDNISMGVNVQLFFYRNAKGKVLVKILRNEKETRVSGLKPQIGGVYYKWDTLKKFWKKRADSKYRLQ